jgi:hypothetical protein
VNDPRLWHPWLRINRVLRVMLHTRWSAEAWSVVMVEFRKAWQVSPPVACRTRPSALYGSSTTWPPAAGLDWLRGRLDQLIVRS